MQARLSHVSAQFLEMKGTMLSLKQAEKDFRKLFSLKSKSAVLESVDPGDTGSLDMEVLREQIEAAMQSVSEIRRYIAEQKDIHLASPSAPHVYQAACAALRATDALRNGAGGCRCAGRGSRQEQPHHPF